MATHIVRPNRSRYGILPTALTVAALAGGMTAPATAQEVDSPVKIAVVSLDQVALQSPAGQKLQQEVIKFQEDLTAELQARQQAAKDIERRIAEVDSLAIDERRALEREYQDALTDFQRFQQDKQEQADALRADGLARIQEELGPVIEAVQSELGYDLVLNSQNSLVVIFSDRIDITQLVIERLQSAGASSS